MAQGSPPVTERKLPSIELARLETRREQTYPDAEFGERMAVDLTDHRLFEGILLRRSCAALLDFVIVSIISTVLWLGNCVATAGTLGLVSAPAFLLAPVVIHLLLCTYLLGGPQGASFGMRMFSVRLVNTEGRRVDHVQAFLTTAMFFAVTPIFVPVLVIGFFTDRARLLHDIVVGTIAIRSDRV
jgi:uncharacterized RDD family membrane protein YckC